MSLTLSQPIRRAEAKPAIESTRQWTVVTAVLFVAIVALLAYRATTKLNIPGSPDGEHLWLSDFRDAVYYPVVAFLDGHNPYDAPAYLRTYPVWQTLALYSPLTLLVHLPLGLLPYTAAEIAYFAATVLLTLALAYVTLTLCGARSTPAAVFGAGTLLLLSRPGYTNLLLGQCTLQVVFGSYLALGYARRRDWLAGAGLALATLKPTFGGPLVLLMLARGNARAVVIGLAVAAVLSIAVTTELAYASGGLLPFLATLPANYAATAAEAMVDPSSSPIRVDAVALVGRLLARAPVTAEELAISLAVLGGAMIGLRRLAARQHERGWQLVSAALVCLTILVCTYHQVYDLLLLAWPIAILVVYPDAVRPIYTPILRWILLALLTFPAINHLISDRAMSFVGGMHGWWLVLASLNGGVLLVAFCIHVALALRTR